MAINESNRHSAMWVLKLFFNFLSRIAHLPTLQVERRRPAAVLSISSTSGGAHTEAVEHNVDIGKVHKLPFARR